MQHMRRPLLRRRRASCWISAGSKEAGMAASSRSIRERTRLESVRVFCGRAAVCVSCVTRVREFAAREVCERVAVAATAAAAAFGPWRQKFYRFDRDSKQDCRYRFRRLALAQRKRSTSEHVVGSVSVRMNMLRPDSDVRTGGVFPQHTTKTGSVLPTLL